MSFLGKSDFLKFLAGACSESRIALDSHDTSQREALARAEAERDGARDALSRVRTQNEMLRDKCSEYVAFIEKLLCQRNTAQAQLAEAVGLLSDTAGCVRIEGLYPYHYRRIEVFLARHAQAAEVTGNSRGPAQAEQQEAKPATFADAIMNPPRLPPRLKEAQGAQASEFQREDRYIVIKRKDFYRLPMEMRLQFSMALRELAPRLPKREYLVVESDWPEYEPTWAAIQARVEGRAALAAQPAAGEPVSEFFVDFDTLRKALSIYGLAAPVSNEELGLQMDRQAVRVIEAVARLPFPYPPAAAHGDELYTARARLSETLSLLRKVDENGHGLDGDLHADIQSFLAGNHAAHVDDGVREDAERWRYGAEHGFPDAMRQIHPVEGPVYWVRDWQQGGEQFETAEAAIDAAMRAQGDGHD